MTELENEIEREGQYKFSFRGRKNVISGKVIIEILREESQSFICMDWSLAIPISKYFICLFNASIFLVLFHVNILFALFTGRMRRIYSLKSLSKQNDSFLLLYM